MFGRFLGLLDGQQGLSLTVLRGMMGMMLGYAGGDKLFQGDLGVRLFTRLGVPWAEVSAPVVAALELGGGLLLFLGLFTRVLGVVYSLEFLVAAYLVAISAGLRAAWPEAMLLAGALVLATHGGGDYAADQPGHPWEP